MDTVADGLQSLRNGLRLAEAFALFVAVVNRPVQRNALIRELAGSVPDLKFSTVRLTQTTVDPLDEVLQQAGNQPSGPVMVVDFDAALPSDVTFHPMLQALNLARPKWPDAIRHPVIFWVPEYVLTILARESPDFLDWRSMTVFFTEGTEADLIPFQSELWEGGTNNRFTLEERVARITELESRLGLYGGEEDDPGVLKVKALWTNELALHFVHIGEPKRATARLKETLELCRRTKDRAFEAVALANLGMSLMEVGDARAASLLFEQALALSRDLGDRRKEGYALGNLGIAFDLQGDSRKAVECHLQHIAIARETGDRAGLATALGNLGNSWHALGEIRKAISTCEQLLQVFRETGDPVGEGNALINLGNARTATGEPRQAISLIEQALPIIRKNGDKRAEGNALGSLGNAFLILGDTQRAIRYHEQALARFRNIGDLRMEGIAFGNMANAWLASGDLQRAIDLYKSCATIADKTGDRRDQAQATFNLALAFYRLGRFLEAARDAETAMEIFTEIGSPYAERARELLADCRRHAMS